MQSREWFKQAKFGMFIHWGLFSLPAGEWKGRRTPEISEWTQSYFRIPNQEYTKLARAFNPVLFDAEEWVQLAQYAGMKYIVFTTKHHDGFAMYKSDVSDFNIVDATPFGRDVLGELAAACKKHGMKLGLYYSNDLDWHEKDGGGYTHKLYCRAGSSWSNDWDFPDASEKNFDRYYEGKVKPQVREILTKYGEISCVWFDCSFTTTIEKSKELVDLVHELQPNCLVNSRVGNGLGDYGSAADNEVPDDDKGEALFETPATINDSWGYKAFDNNWKTLDQIADIKRHLNERGINYLLNVGPDYLGRFPAPAVQILSYIGERK